MHEFRFRAFLAVLRLAVWLCPQPERRNILGGLKHARLIRSLIDENVTAETEEFEIKLEFRTDR